MILLTLACRTKTRNRGRFSCQVHDSYRRRLALDACPELEQTHQLLRGYAQVLARRTDADLPDWISIACDVQLPGITGFARGPTADLEAVIVGLTAHWSSGGTEDAVTHVKEIKRQLYGRAGFDRSAK